MCFDPVTATIVTGALTALGSATSSILQINAQNNAAAQQYNNQVDQFNQVQAAALAQHEETNARLRLQRRREAGNAFEQAQQTIRENQRRQAAARASAGTSGLMGLPLNVIDQTFEAAIGSINANLADTYRQLNENFFISTTDARLQTQSTINQAVPGDPFFQSFGAGHLLAAGIQGAGAAMSTGASLGLFNKQPKQQQQNFEAPDNATTAPLPTDPFNPIRF